MGMIRLVGINLFPKPAIVTVYCGQTLQQGLKKKKYTKNEYISIIGQLIFITHHLTKHNFCHCDIKSDNIAIKNTKEGIAVSLIDLGMMKEFGYVPNWMNK